MPNYYHEFLAAAVAARKAAQDWKAAHSRPKPNDKWERDWDSPEDHLIYHAMDQIADYRRYRYLRRMADEDGLMDLVESLDNQFRRYGTIS